jgi:hypothetical protein
LSGKNLRQLIQCLNRVWIGLQNLAKLLFSLAQLAGILQRHSQSIVRIGRIRLQGDCSTEMKNGGCVALLSDLDHPEIVESSPGLGL